MTLTGRTYLWGEEASVTKETNERLSGHTTDKDGGEKPGEQCLRNSSENGVGRAAGAHVGEGSSAALEFFFLLMCSQPGPLSWVGSVDGITVLGGALITNMNQPRPLLLGMRWEGEGQAPHCMNRKSYWGET